MDGNTLLQANYVYGRWCQDQSQVKQIDGQDSSFFLYTISPQREKKKKKGGGGRREREREYVCVCSCVCVCVCECVCDVQLRSVG